MKGLHNAQVMQYFRWHYYLAIRSKRYLAQIYWFTQLHVETKNP